MGLFGKKKKPPEPEPDNAKPSPITKNGKKFSVIVDSEEVAKINALLNAAKTMKNLPKIAQNFYILFKSTHKKLNFFFNF